MPIGRGAGRGLDESALGDRTQTADRGRARGRQDVMQPYLQLAFHGARPADAGVRWSLAGVRSVSIGRGERREGTRQDVDGQCHLRVRIDDEQITREHLRIDREEGRWVARDLGSRNGTRCDGALLAEGEPFALEDGALLCVGRAALLWREAPVEPRLPSQLERGHLDGVHPRLATFSSPLRRRFAELAKVVRRAPPAILLRGPTGCGKDVVARALHDLTGRDGPLVAVNCAAIAANLVEAELFGATRGAYSGAIEDRPGLVRAADGGTLFLDEVADLRPAAQAALLRVVETREVLAVGATRPVPVDITIVAASHRDLEAMMEDESLRRDLYARLAGFELTLPALRERPEDLGLLVDSFIREEGDDGVSFSAEASEALCRHDWPFNVRELKAAVHRAVALADGEPIELDHLPPAVASASVAQAPDSQATSSDSPRDARLHAQLTELLDRHAGNVAAVARELDKHPRQIHRWLKRVNIDPNDFRHY